MFHLYSYYPMPYSLFNPVSYTHLDVYKRQVLHRALFPYSIENKITKVCMVWPLLSSCVPCVIQDLCYQLFGMRCKSTFVPSAVMLNFFSYRRRLKILLYISIRFVPRGIDHCRESYVLETLCLSLT